MMFLKGQIVYLEKIQHNHNDRSGEIEQGVVTIVGRKYYTVALRNYEYRFDKETLHEVTEMGGPTYSVFPSEQAIYDDRERVELYRWLRAVVGAYNCTLTLDQLRRIKIILDEDTKI